MIQDNCEGIPESWCWAGVKNKLLHNLKVLRYSINVHWQLRSVWAGIFGIQFACRFLEEKGEFRSPIHLWVRESVRHCEHFSKSIHYVLLRHSHELRLWQLWESFEMAWEWMVMFWACVKYLQTVPGWFLIEIEKICGNREDKMKAGLFTDPMKYHSVYSMKCMEMPYKFRCVKYKKKYSAQYILRPVTYDFLTIQIPKVSEEL